MKKLIAVLLVMMAFGIGLDVAVRMNRPAAPSNDIGNQPLRKPIRTMLREMRKNGGRISEDDAKTVSLEIWKELWGPETKARVETCEWDEHSGLWTISVVMLDSNKQPSEASVGCEVIISDLGDLDKVQYCSSP